MLSVSGRVFVCYNAAVRSVDVTYCRDALSGYQKGAGFYPNAPISLDPDSPLLCDVDHFFPHTLKQVPEFAHINIDSVWNFVLAQQECNRGKNGKFARLPSIRLLEKLHTRNEYFIESHHPLRETIINQTGTTQRERRALLQAIYSQAKQALIHEWTLDCIALPF